MKKFDHWHVIQVAGYPAYKSPTTYWVKAEEAEALEQLNKEMLYMLKDVFEFIGAADDMEWEDYRPKKQSIRHRIVEIIAKAEEV